MFSPLVYIAALAAAPSYSPAPATAERAAIADAVRRRLQTEERIVFSHLRVVRHRGERHAFAVFRPRERVLLGAEGWLVLTDYGEGWRAYWGIVGASKYSCGGHRIAFETTLDLVRRISADPGFLPVGFTQGRAYTDCSRNIGD